MRDYAELVKALRYCSDISDFRGCLECIYERKCRAHSRDRACINRPLVMMDAADAIEELRAQIPKTGKWILIDMVDDQCGARLRYIYCSVCNKQSLCDHHGFDRRSRYCPSCGAKMEVTSDDKP